MTPERNNDNLVQFRAFGRVGDELTARAGQDAGRTEYSHIASRDLERYYEALRTALCDIPLTGGEAQAICDALHGTLMAPSTVSVMWAEIDDALRHNRLAAKWQVDGPALIGKLRQLSYVQALAVVDAAERYWAISGEGSTNEDAMRRIGLV